MTTFSKPKLLRRTVLIGIAACLASSGLAGGGSENSTNFNAGINKNPAVKKKYTQREFSRLSRNEINQLYFNMIQKRGSVIDGFSKNMSSHLVSMAQADRRRTAKLLLQMKGLKTKKERVERLRQEQQWAEKQYGKLKEAKARAESRGNGAAAQETQGQMDRIRRFRDAVKTWSQYPNEGQR